MSFGWIMEPAAEISLTNYSYPDLCHTASPDWFFGSLHRHSYNHIKFWSRPKAQLNNGEL